MAKRFFASEIWDEDWFLDMPGEYRQFWFYMIGKCDHAGIFRVNLKSARSRIEGDLRSSKALELINNGKQRVRVLKDDIWFIEDFFVFQYGPKFNINNKVHESIAKVYERHGVDIKTIRGLTEVNLTPKTPQKDPKHGAKDKDKEEANLGTGEREGGAGEEKGAAFVPIGIGPQMVQVFVEAFPAYPVDQHLDFSACLEIAQKIAKGKGWAKESVTNGKQADIVSIWLQMIGFIRSDKWFSTRSISDINREFQRLSQSIQNSGTHQQQPNSSNAKTAGVNRLLSNLKQTIESGGKQNTGT